MPRAKIIEIPKDDGEPDEPKGEALPALEDFVRKMSGSFSENIKPPEIEQPDDEEEDDDENGD